MHKQTTISILIVDDELISRFIHKNLINSLNLKTVYYEAANGEEALDLINSMYNTRPSIILLDLNMPIMGGFEFIAAYKKLPNTGNTKIVVISSSQDPGDISRCSILGVHKFLSKPATSHCLQTLIIETQIERYRSAA